MDPTPADEPPTVAVDVVLREGSTIPIRPVRAGDEARLLAFLRDLEPRSRWLRFFSFPSDRFLLEAAHTHAVAHERPEVDLIAVAGVTEAIVAHGHDGVVGRDRA